ncbi:MAG: response regulator transcription factor [Thermodesulfobacteriota bacterium]|nr:response regulator transcription factor [Thermodesulfobacteriota bacterium]
MDKIRVLLAEDHTIVRKGIHSLLDGETNIDVIGEAGDGRDALKKVEQLRPDVVVMDIAMPVLNGLEATRRIKKLFPEIKVLILTVHTNEEYIFQVLRAGASGYLVKQAAPAELISGIKAVWRGDSFLSPTISRKVIEEYIWKAESKRVGQSYDNLTNREREVLQLIAEGKSTREIADLLCVSVKTVETHRAHLRDKLNIHSTAELTKYAIRTGMTSPEQ